MKFKRISWLIFSCLVVAGLLLTSCGPAEEEEEEVVDGEDGEAIPQYGGELKVIVNRDTRTLDDSYVVGFYGCWSLCLTNEELFEGDWARGPAGTNETDWLMYGGFQGSRRLWSKGIAESWEVDEDNNAMILHLQKGVHWHDKAPTNGREVNAEDVKASIERQWNIPGTFLSGAYPKPTATVIDNSTVSVAYDSYSDLAQSVNEIGDTLYIWPKDALEANDNDMRDWHDSIGTGPYILTDYVKGSSFTLVRNDNYWDKDPIGPGKGNQLPYLDGVKILIVPDASSRIAAIRTGEGDQLGEVGWEDAASLKKTNPELKWARLIQRTEFGISLRVDKDYPWNDKRVRQALMMSIDYDSIANSFYGGEAEVYSNPTPPPREFDPMRVPFDDLPENVQELFSYNPGKAKQLLDDAGYGDGFDMTIPCQTSMVDLMSVVKDYFEKIGVNVTIEPKEVAVYNSMRFGRTFEGAFAAGLQSSVPWVMDQWRGPATNPFNAAFVDCPKCVEAHKEIWDNYMDWDKRYAIWKEITPYLIEECWYIPMPAYAQYTFWQPWVQACGGYHGEYGTGNSDEGTFPKWVWLDQDLKAEMQ